MGSLKLYVSHSLLAGRTYKLDHGTLPKRTQELTHDPSPALFEASE